MRPVKDQEREVQRSPIVNVGSGVGITSRNAEAGASAHRHPLSDQPLATRPWPANAAHWGVNSPSSNLIVPVSEGRHVWNDVKALVLNSVSSRHSKRAYESSLDDFAAWLASQPDRYFDRGAVLQYRAELEIKGLLPSTVNVRLSAIRRLASEAADAGLLSAQMAAAILRVRGPKRLGTRSGLWLTSDQADALLALPDTGCSSGKRDLALLSTLIGSGLRREEAAQLTFSHLQSRSGRWAIVDLVGKGGRIRTVAVPNWTKVAIDEWGATAGLAEGRVFRRMYKGGKVSEAGLGTQAIFQVVQKYGRRLGLVITPHDLRRTYAKLAYDGEAALEQIQFSLGHASISTTEVYLGARQDLRRAPCDCLGLSWSRK